MGMQSTERDNCWLIAARIRGDGVPTGTTGLWITNAHDVQDREGPRVYAVNEHALHFTEWVARPDWFKPDDVDTRELIHRYEARYKAMGRVRLGTIVTLPTRGLP